MLELTLIQAAQVGDVDAARRAIKTGADLHALDVEKKYPPLCWAARNGHLEVVQLLVESGADVDQVDSDPSESHYVKGRIEAGADPTGSHWGYTAVGKAAYAGHEAIVSYLLEHGADVRRDWMNGDAVLHSAARGGSARIVEDLLDHGADIEAFFWLYGTPLAVAASLAQVDIVQTLIDRGADLDRQDEGENQGQCFTPVMWAVEAFNGYVERNDPAAEGWHHRRSDFLCIVEALVRAGADLQLRNASSTTVHEMAGEQTDLLEVLGSGSLKARLRRIAGRLGLPGRRARR